MKPTLLLAILCLLLCISSNLSNAQQTKNKKSHYSLLVKARAQKDKILLRWAINDPIAWKTANQFGYMVERYTILSHGNVNTIQHKKLLTPTPLKPKPEAHWETLVNKDGNAAIVAQGIYGESFQVTGNGDSKLAKIINQSDELNQRYTFSLLAADRSFEAAQMAGWGIMDSTVLPDEKYLYRVYVAAPKEKIKIDTAGAYIGIRDYAALPQPKDLYGVYGDKTVMLSWNYKLLKDIYNVYYVERSEDGSNFSKLSDLPVANLNEKDDYTPSKMFYTDTLQDNNKKYYYRIRGVTCFNEVSPPSEIVNGKGKAILAYVPNIKSVDILNDSTAKINWEISDEARNLIDHFELNQSTNAKDGTYKILDKSITPDKRAVIATKLLPTNYFTITAVDKNGNRRNSFPFLVQPVDSTPPSVPTGLAATIDTLGNVTLKWNANTEPDLLGYEIIKSNNRKEEPALLNSTPFRENIYKEKINLKTLNSRVYYAVIALDKRMNQSKPCTLAELVKPDKIPPTTPIFKSYSVTDDGKVSLDWVNSNSDDVATHKLYRKNVNENNWTLLQTFTDTAHSYLDDSVKNSQTVVYTLIAADRSNNKSQPAPPLTVTIKNTIKIAGITIFKGAFLKDTREIVLNWVYESKDVAQYTIYKARNKEAYTTWKVLNANQTKIHDKDILTSNAYRYAIRAMLKDGRMSTLKEVKVAF